MQFQLNKNIILFSLIILMLPISMASSETIEAKGRIKWEMLKIEQKRLELEEKRLRLEMTRLEIDACDQIYKAGGGERIACVKRAMQHLIIPKP